MWKTKWEIRSIFWKSSLPTITTNTENWPRPEAYNEERDVKMKNEKIKYFLASVTRCEKLTSFIEVTLKSHWSSKKRAVSAINQPITRIYEIWNVCWMMHTECRYNDGKT